MRASALVSLVVFAAACSNNAQPGAKPPLQTTNATPAPRHTPPALRLPKTVQPKAYAVAMHLSPTEERFEGKVTVDLALAEATDVIWFHAADNLDVKSAKLTGNGMPPLTSPIERAGDEMVGVSFSQKVPAGTYKLELAYDGKLPSRDGRGAYRQEEQGSWYVYTQFESTSARRAFPCFDEPGFKAPWTIALEVPKDQLAFANTPQTNEAPAKDGWKTVSFAPTKPLPSYLVAFAVGPFEVVDGGRAGEKKVPVRIIVPKGKSAEAKYAAQTTGQVLERLEKYLGMPYPYEKLDHIAVPQKGGAMENPGLITYGTTTMLGKPDEKSVRLERGYLAIAAHELGHIWFGDLVTTEWWDDIWLNESFATWISAKIVDEWHPEWDGAVNRVHSKNGVMGNDQLVSARRIRQPIESKHDIVNAFDGITYQKGAAVLAMFEAFAGQEPWRKAIRGYLVKHAHGNATANDFLKDIGEALPDVPAALSTFLDQPGIPLVTAELVCDKTPKLVLAQQRYLPLGSTGGTDQSWKLPVCASYPGGKSCTLMTSASAELPLTEAKTCPAWVNANAGANGYYRTFYKGDLFARLMKGGNKAVSVPERVASLGDAIALVRSGRMQDGDVLAFVPDLVREGDRHLVGMTTGLVSGLSDKLVTDEVRPNYRRLIAKLYTERAKQLGWQPKPNEDDGTRLLRPGLLSLVARDESNAFSADARKLAEAWLSDRKAVDRDLVGTVLWTAARNGDQALWDKYRAEAKRAAERRDRNEILSAMGGFTDPKIVEQNFQLLLSDEFDPRESTAVLYGASSDRKTRSLAYELVKANFDKLTARMPQDWGASLTNVAGGFCDAEHRADAEAFFKDKIAKLQGGPRTLAQNLESISLCEAQVGPRKASVAGFLKKY